MYQYLPLSHPIFSTTSPTYATHSTPCPTRSSGHGSDINRELVREGHAWVYRQYLEDESLLKDEAAAKEEQLGLWSLADPVAPWEWRRGKRTGSASTPGKSFTCGTKTYCREMGSCEEARFYLSSCELTRLDGDGDGIPCEAICRP
jgi:hypothetical protein